MKTVFVNPERCIGCRQCEFACAVEHSDSRDPTLAMSESPLPHSRIHVEPGAAFNTSFPNKCRHCDPAPCEQVCPTAAIARDSGHDLVLIDTKKCIACAMCAMVCPFDVISFNAQSNGIPLHIVASKCDGCVDRIDHGQEPACVEACKAGALVFGELTELIRDGRIRESTAVLTAVSTIEQQPPRLSENVAAWRRWGTSARTVTDEEQHGKH